MLDSHVSSMIASLAARSSNSPTQPQWRTTKLYTLPPPQLYQKLQFTNLYIPLPDQRLTWDNRDIPSFRQETPPQRSDEFGVRGQPE